MEIEQDLFNKLTKLSILKQNMVSNMNHENQRFLLNKEATEMFENGLMFSKYLSVIAKTLVNPLNQYPLLFFIKSLI
jgi:hypothetical protein